MCDKCFEQGYKSFEIEDEWRTFDLILTQKLGTGFLVDNGYTPIGRDEFEYFYTCRKCNQEWKLREPSDKNKGYFLNKV